MAPTNERNGAVAREAFRHATRRRSGAIGRGGRMKRITLKQSWSLAFGLYAKQARHEKPQAQTDFQRRLRDAESRANTICWKCDKERPDSTDNCPDCNARCTPFIL